MKTQTRPKQSGFTITELMFASAISLMVLTTLFGSVRMINSVIKVSIDEAQATSNGLLLIQQFELDARGISEVLEISDEGFSFITTDRSDNESEIHYSIRETAGSYELIRVDSTDGTERSMLYADEGEALTGIDFTYYNQMGVEANTATDTNAVKLEVERSIEGVGATVTKDLSIRILMFRNKAYDLTN